LELVAPITIDAENAGAIVQPKAATAAATVKESERRFALFEMFMIVSSQSFEPVDLNIYGQDCKGKDWKPVFEELHALRGPSFPPAAPKYDFQRK